MKPNFTRFALSMLCSLAVAASAADARADEPTSALVEAELVRPRDGLGNVLAKLRDGQVVNIAYLGGSITAAAGWRVKTREWFAGEFPNSKVNEIHAAIGGTGSDLGVFRVHRDALRHQPDLLFVEFAVNDGGATPERIWQAMEGIVRQTWAANPRTDICFVYTYRVGYESDLRKGLCPRAASAMEMLADHYGIASINFALKIVELEAAGKLVFQSDQPTEPGVVQFSKDGVHPLDGGHQIYADIVAGAVRQMRDSKPIDHRSKLSASVCRRSLAGCQDGSNRCWDALRRVEATFAGRRSRKAIRQSHGNAVGGDSARQQAPFSIPWFIGQALRLARTRWGSSRCYRRRSSARKADRPF